jgi:hypothetical protein
MSDGLDLLVESAANSWRERDASGRIVPPPAWWDLAPDERMRAFDAQVATRELERAVDPDELSGTVRAVLARLLG